MVSHFQSFPPMLWLIEHMATLNFTSNPSDYTRAKFLNHPGTRMFFRDRIGRFITKRTRRFESIPWVVIGMP